MNGDLRSETVQSRLARIRSGLSPREWARVDAMARFVLSSKVLGWEMLDAGTGVCRLDTS
jgi:hypothetical protein